MNVSASEITVGCLEELDDPGSREFRTGEGDWPFRGFVVRRGEAIFAYRNYCMHVGHPLNWQPDRFLTEDGGLIVCSSHGALYEIDTGVCVAGPCRGAELIPLPVEIRDGKIVVQVPAAER